ncbi:hypothetical protein GOP47_0012938 [Adiantum capillus-veneris]|uniref:Uncharacterized protein n=1 Tax=Adiantum capillus-veneris TaxID=13818 RepID=A0A9D4ZG61_ADICA|nr:hypothetical protein GOP47_0012938 [Adiantum capillus-veneris]
MQNLDVAELVLDVEPISAHKASPTKAPYASPLMVHAATRDGILDLLAANPVESNAGKDDTAIMEAFIAPLEAPCLVVDHGVGTLADDYVIFLAASEDDDNVVTTLQTEATTTPNHNTTTLACLEITSIIALERP